MSERIYARNHLKRPTSPPLRMRPQPSPQRAGKVIDYSNVTKYYNDFALRGVEGRSVGYKNRKHSPAIEGVLHHIDIGTLALRPPSKRPNVRCTTQYSPSCLKRHSDVWRPDASAKENGSGGHESRVPSLSSQGR